MIGAVTGHFPTTPGAPHQYKHWGSWCNLAVPHVRTKWPSSVKHHTVVYSSHSLHFERQLIYIYIYIDQWQVFTVYNSGVHIEYIPWQERGHDETCPNNISWITSEPSTGTVSTWYISLGTTCSTSEIFLATCTTSFRLSTAQMMSMSSNNALEN